MSCDVERSFSLAPRPRVRAMERGVFELTADWSGPAPQPGQFFMLRPERSGHFLGRPLSVYGFSEGRISFLVAERGGGTAELASLAPTDGLLLEGPLGSAWPRAEPGARLALVAGGVGLAPIAFLARSLAPASYDLYAGFRGLPWELSGLAPKRLVLSSEAGTGAPRGRILDFFNAGDYDAICVCGPEPMLAACGTAASAADVRCWLSLERRMACGVGACLGCTIRTRSGNRRCCVDGPIFPAEEVLFDGDD